ncbi:hypothetical protein IW492_02645 [Enterococcus sp. BWB1-3]|uniref:hypothetical protein n=1 Tax=Enterococcus sp. BWB1-3 TaxID=2787713 RepID=UPI00192094A0|nr:hypothetical protein [Enterococcus sp. BWB1-3]MBL1228130.1 hypothetical protein [Enterococcus sp. BWB1-3]
MLSELFEDMEPIAIRCGIKADRFWSLSYQEIIREVEAYKENRIQELKEQAQLAYAQANLTSYSVHAPQKMPKQAAAFPILGVQETGYTKQKEELPQWKIDQMKMLEVANAIKKTREKRAKK